jgi:hypothetical protein
VIIEEGIEPINKTMPYKFEKIIDSDVEEEEDSLDSRSDSQDDNEPKISTFLADIEQGNYQLHLSKEYIKHFYQVIMLDVPRDGHKFLHALNRFFKIETGETIALARMFTMIKEYFSVNEHHIETSYTPTAPIVRPSYITDDDTWEREQTVLKVARFHHELENYFNEGLYASKTIRQYIALMA